MSQLEKLLANAAKAMGVTLEDLQTIVKQGERKSYAAGEYLFHESTPRLWAVGWKRAKSRSSAEPRQK